MGFSLCKRAPSATLPAKPQRATADRSFPTAVGFPSRRRGAGSSRRASFRLGSCTWTGARAR